MTSIYITIIAAAKKVIKASVFKAKAFIKVKIFVKAKVFVRVKAFKTKILSYITKFASSRNIRDYIYILAILSLLFSF